MLNLIKYEFRKTMGIKFILLILVAIVEAILLYGLYAEMDGPLAIGIFLLVFGSFIGIAVIGVYSITLLNKDLNTKQSYMLFMTPNSSYKILGAKMIENSLSLIIAGACIIAIYVLDVTLIMAKYGELSDLVELFNYFVSDEMQLNYGSIISSLVATLASWLYIISVAFLAVVISATYLNGRKFNWIISFGIFLLITIVIGRIRGLFIDSTVIDITVSYNITQIIVYIILTAIMYLITATIMERQLSV